VSIRCAGRRVSHGPLAAVAVRPGAVVRAGAAIGTLAAGHRGLHVGVRREADPFGYEDPAGLLPATRRPSAPLPPPARPRGPAPRPRAGLPRPAAPAPHRPAAPATAPGLVWAGLALLATGAAGTGTLALRRRRRLAAAPAGGSLR
jgi:hypothetical protein